VREEVLPPGWAHATIGELFVFRGGGTPDKTQASYWNGEIPWASVKDIKSPQLHGTKDTITQDGLKNSAASIAEIDDVILVTRISPGETAVSKIRCAINQDLKIVRPPPGMAASFIRLLFRHLQPKIVSLSSGTTVLGIRLNELSSINLPLPPLAEQKRIVAKIEELFSELKAGEESLRLARRQLATYRQSLLKQAFEGKLTTTWRTQNPDKLESPASLTAAIDARSRNANFRAKEDHAIPSWAYRTLDELTESVTSGSRGWADYYAESGSVFIRAQNLNQDFLNLADIAYVRLPDSAEGKRTRVKYGDLLITITGANTTKAGWVSTKLDEAYVSQHVALCRPISDALSPFLYRYIVAEAGGRKKLTTDAYGAGKPGLNLDNVRSLTVPLPPLPEQQEIVRLLDEQFEVIERNEREIDAALQRSEALRQSILHRAFTGRLVPQNPADEPTSELLARLRAEKARATTEASGKKPRNRRLASLPKK